MVLDKYVDLIVPESMTVRPLSVVPVPNNRFKIPILLCTTVHFYYTIPPQELANVGLGNFIEQHITTC